MPRRHDRNNCRRCRSFSPSLEIVVPLTACSNAKNPDGPGGIYIGGSRPVVMVCLR
jgi:hypothetical protein